MQPVDVSAFKERLDVEGLARGPWINHQSAAEDEDVCRLTVLWVAYFDKAHRAQ